MLRTYLSQFMNYVHPHQAPQSCAAFHSCYFTIDQHCKSAIDWSYYHGVRPPLPPPHTHTPEPRTLSYCRSHVSPLTLDHSNRCTNLPPCCKSTSCLSRPRSSCLCAFRRLNITSIPISPIPPIWLHPSRTLFPSMNLTSDEKDCWRGCPWQSLEPPQRFLSLHSC